MFADERLNDVALALLIGLSAIVILTVVHVQQLRRLYRVRRSLQVITGDLKGTLVEMNFTDYAGTRLLFQDHVHFEHRGKKGELRFCWYGPLGYYSCVEIGWTRPRMKCEIIAKHLVGIVRRLIFGRELDLYLPILNDRFLVFGDTKAAEILTEDVQVAVVELAEASRSWLLRRTTVYILFTGVGLTVMRKGLLRSVAELHEFIRLSENLYDVARPKPQAVASN